MAGSGGMAGAGGMSMPDFVQECRDYVGCRRECETNECLNQCTADASEEAVTRYQSILDCIDREGCRDFQGNVDDDCYYSECTAEIEACFGPLARPVGDNTCGQYNRCLGRCPSGDSDCRDNCLRNTAADSYAIFELSLIHI